MSSPTTRVALITGTSRGIGTALATAFAADGCAVVGCGRSAGPAVDVAGVDYRRCDVSDPAAIRHLVAGTVAAHGRLDVLVNNAAIEIEGTVEETTVEQWDEVLAVNVRAPALLAAAAIPHMRAVGGGVILNIASVDGTWAEPRLPAYCATKRALLALTRAMAIDHTEEGIRVNCVYPGPVDTPMLAWTDATPELTARERGRTQGRNLSGRSGRPEEIAATIAFLLSDDAGFMSGSIVAVDGAWTAG
jgi:NAD(P)-dependent dehydrogenase (short-subunit alcohol dehydrogenase family)